MKIISRIFGSDIDDTLTDTAGFIKRLVWKKFGIDLSAVKFTRYYYEQLFDILPPGVRGKVFNEFRISECVNIKPLEEAVWALKILKENSFYLPLVTSRDLDAKGKTEEWLKKEKEIICHQLIFSHEKWELDIPFDFFAEDSPRQSIKLAERGVKVFLLDKEWNRGLKHPNIIRVRDWAEIMDLLRFFAIIK